MPRTVWYPGHMAKGTRKLNELVSKLDLIVEVRDARAPASTSSPLIKALAKIKPVIHVLSRKDLADPAKLQSWLSSLKHTYAADLRKREGLSAIKKAILKFKPSHREVRLAVVGIPNVGKSLLLNSLIGKSNAGVGNIPGITKSVSWYRNEGMLIVDSPGILDPHAEAGAHLILSWLGCAKAEVVGGYENAASALIKFLISNDMQNLIPVEPDGASTLEAIGRKYGCLISGGRVNMELAGQKFIEAFSSGRLGLVCLEMPGEQRAVDFDISSHDDEAVDFV
ncbi:MAG: 50S ribosome-binding GTPase [Synergistaceae bacterium]|nr:50S ribosome-binding GTPase [Synergistaceae bacterium]MBR0093834.1 50S ribosome-binding GTPase [Synergistaceae bacterium]